MGNLQYKGANVSSIESNDDEGTVRAIVSVTGIVDNVKDIIAPGAYEKSLKNRIPKGVWQHQWTESIAKTESIRELMPGDPELPKTLANGQPWPSEAGGLLVDMKFNLRTQRGRDAYEDVKFYGNQQEWSIGYSVPPGGATKDSKGIRTIHTLDLYEYSPVLFGAMSNARTTSVKDAQSALMELKNLYGDDAEQIMQLTAEIFAKKSADAKNADDVDDDGEDDDDLEDVIDNNKEEKGDRMDAAPSKELIVNAINALQALLGSAGEQPHEEKSLYDLMDEAGLEGKILDTADEFDAAIDNGDIALAEKSAVPVLDFVEAMLDIDGVDEKSIENYKEFASYIGESLNDLQAKSDDVDDDGFEDDDLEDEANADSKNEEKSFVRVSTNRRTTNNELESKSDESALSLFADADSEDSFTF